MKHILYCAYFGAEGLRKGYDKISIHVPNLLSIKKFLELGEEETGLMLAGVMFNNKGVLQFFSDVMWGKGVHFYLEDMSGMDPTLVSDLEKMLKEEEGRDRFGKPSREILDKRRSRKENYIPCLLQIIPSWSDAEYVAPEDVLDWCKSA